MRKPTSKPRLNEAEAAEYIGAAVGTLRNWRAQRRGPYYFKVGRTVTYTLDDLKGFIESCRREPTKRQAKRTQDAKQPSDAG